MSNRDMKKIKHSEEKKQNFTIAALNKKHEMNPKIIYCYKHCQFKLENNMNRCFLVQKSTLFLSMSKECFNQQELFSLLKTI